jgi:hypothetical protein
LKNELKESRVDYCYQMLCTDVAKHAGNIKLRMTSNAVNVMVRMKIYSCIKVI